MAVEHIITQSDTLYSLAENYLNDVNRWREIADYNGLHAPYIVEDRTEVDKRYGQGYLTITRPNFTSALTIPAGYKFHSKPYLIGGMVKDFTTTSQTTVPAGTATFYVHVRCTVPGTYGNVSEGYVTEPGRVFKVANIAFTSVINEQPFEGGLDIKMLTVGDPIYIPTDVIERLAPENIREQLEYIGGEDFMLAGTTYERYIPADGYGDYMSVSGLDNIVQAINDRLMTEKGDLPLHPEYGTNLAALIGSHQLPYTSRLVELEIYDALSYEDRIKDVTITRLEIDGTSIRVELQFKPYFAPRVIPLSVSLDFSRRVA